MILFIVLWLYVSGTINRERERGRRAVGREFRTKKTNSYTRRIVRRGVNVVVAFLVAGVCNLALFHPPPPDFHPLHTPCNPFDPFPLSRSNAVAVLFFLPSHPLSGSFALIHRSPRPSPLTPQSSTFPGLLSSLVDEERERGNATQEGRLSFTSTNECRSFNVTMRRPLRWNYRSRNITIHQKSCNLRARFLRRPVVNWPTRIPSSRSFSFRSNFVSSPFFFRTKKSYGDKNKNPVKI